MFVRFLHDRVEQYAEALELVTPLLEEPTLTDAQEAQAHLIAAECYGDASNKLDAKNQLESARALGYDAAKCQALEEKLDL